MTSFRRNCILFIFFLVLAFILFFPKLSLAWTVSYTTECGETFSIGSCWTVMCNICCSRSGVSIVCTPCCPCCTQCRCYGSWDEYQVESTECGADILVRHCRSVCGPGSACCGCGRCWAKCSTQREVYKEVGSWQKAERSGENACEATQWGLIAPEEKCKGKCIKAPENPRYYDNPNYPTNSCSPESGVNSKNIYLPVKLNWDDVEGWKGGWCKDKCSAECVQSYVINIENTNSTFPKILSDSSFIPPSCALKSNSSHSWQVRACCTATGDNCGPWTNSWPFSTSPVPELVSPYDPDWTGSTGTVNVSIPTDFKWCDTTPYTDTKTYYLRLYKDGAFFYPFPVEKQDGTPPPETIFGIDTLTKYSTYEWEIANCSNEGYTKCGANCTGNQEGSICGDYSQKWKFTTGEITLPAPDIISPKIQNGIPAVNYSDKLSWKPIGIYGVDAYYYEIRDDQKVVASSTIPGEISSVSFADIWKKLAYDKTYTVEVKSCWAEDTTKCEPGTIITFKTTGAVPTNLKIGPLDENGRVVIPVSIQCDAMPGAASYYYEISAATGTISASQSPEGSIDYPDLKTKTQYLLKLKTCADDQGTLCGAAASQSFTTFTLTIPQNPVPANNGNFLTSERYLRWDKILGAKFYQYKVVPGIDVIAPTNSAFLETGLLELGNHAWSVRACLDKDCKEAGEWANFNFNLVQPEECEKEKSLVPCGRDCNSDATPWDDRKPCQLGDVFYIFKNVLDFVLWTLTPLILVLLAIGSGVIYYTSMGDVTTLARVKSIWRSAGIGCLIIFSAWFIVDWILLIIGFQVEVFGHWWQFPF